MTATYNFTNSIQYVHRREGESPPTAPLPKTVRKVSEGAPERSSMESWRASKNSGRSSRSGWGLEYLKRK